MSVSLSKYSSLSFGKYRHSFEVDEVYVQRFAPSDIIRMQFNTTHSDSIALHLTSLNTGKKRELPPSFSLGDGDKILGYLISNIDDDLYKLDVELNGNLLSTTFFKVTSEIEDTILFRYNHRINHYNTLFINDGRLFFDFRVEGGFLYSEMQSLVESESFRQQSNSIVQLSALPYNKKTLTVGSRLGVPQWVGDKVNHILSLSDVRINGVKHTRSEGSAPELSVISEMYPLYVFKVDVEEENTFAEMILGGSDGFDGDRIFDATFDATFN